MSSHAFSPKHGPILLDAEVTGPARGMNLTLVLDTGATTSLINLAILLYLGFDLAQATHSVQVTTGSAVEVVPILVLTRLTVLGQSRFGFPVIAHALPTSSAVDGLLGLDFLRGQELTIDFRSGRITLS